MQYMRQHSTGSLKLIIRKACWDYELESELFSDSVAVSILFAQVKRKLLTFLSISDEFQKANKIKIKLKFILI